MLWKRIRTVKKPRNLAGHPSERPRKNVPKAMGATCYMTNVEMAMSSTTALMMGIQ